MKKTAIIISILCCLVSHTCFASNIEILPAMSSKTTVQDRVWVGTFQLVWNDLIDKFAFGIIKFPDGTPEMVNELNRQEFTSAELTEKCYYKYFGKATKTAKKTIEKAIKKKFKEKSDILDKLSWDNKTDRFVIYAMLKKDFKFAAPFDKLGKSDFKNTSAEYFGIKKSSDKKLRKQVRVLFYNSPNDYAILLETSGDDIVYLYKTSTTNTFNAIYSDMKKKENSFKGNVNLSANDEVKIPNLKFFEEKQFEELSGKRIKGTRYVIDKALETVKFEMNNEGVKLKSEAAISMLATSVGPGNVLPPRLFYFDDTFVMFLQEKNKSKPYFALRVYDIRNFEGR